MMDDVLHVWYVHRVKYCTVESRPYLPSSHSRSTVIELQGWIGVFIGFDRNMLSSINSSAYQTKV